MDDLNDTHRRALDATGRIVSAISATQWDDPTPCEEWDVRALTNHLVSGNLWAAELASGKTIDDVGEALDGDLLGNDPSAAYNSSALAAAAAFEAPGALEQPCAVSYGPVPGSVYAGHRILDVVIHGWDLAVATNQDTTIDPSLVSACWEIVEPQLGALQASGAFGQASGDVDAADEQTKLLDSLGRTRG
jgi:uncharacterized protein (TIGR03086 family)